MRVLVDAVHIEPEMKGVGRYVSNLLGRLPALAPGTFFTALVKDTTPEALLPHAPNLAVERTRWRNHLWHGLRTLPAWGRRSRSQLLWVPYETPARTGTLKLAMGCHGVPRRLREVRSGRGEAPGLAARAAERVDECLLGPTLRSARVVFSNSRYVADWLESEGVRPERIRLAPCAPGADMEALARQARPGELRRELGAPDGYVLVFYTGDPWDNLTGVLEAYGLFVEAGGRQSLVVAGVREAERARVESLLEGRAWRRRVAVRPFVPAGREGEMAALYAAADAYLDASLIEGFGMQVVEAMACGTPVLCSGRGALAEVCGEAATVVDPEDPCAIARCLGEVLADPSRRRSMSCLGRERSRAFRWEETARIVHDGLRDALA